MRDETCVQERGAVVSECNENVIYAQNIRISL